jgi:hypothetical protein
MEPGWEGNTGKACETELEVLEYGKYKVSRVQRQDGACVLVCVRYALRGRNTVVASV